MLRTYSPKDVKILWNGIEIAGLAPDSFVRLSRSSKLLEKTVGSQGDVSLTRIADTTGEIEIELMQTSPSNDVLAAYAFAQENSTSEPPISQLIIKDSGTNLSLVVGVNAWLEGYPDHEYGSSQNTKTWNFGCENLVLLGGQ